MTTTTPEGRVAAALRQAAIAEGAEIRKLSWEGRNGAPDYFVLLAGHVVLIECKAPGGRPRAQQILEAERLLRNGLEVLVLDDAADAAPLMRAVAESKTAELDRFSFTRFRGF